MHATVWPRTICFVIGWGKSSARNKANRNYCCLSADHRPYSSVLGVSIGNGRLAGISPLGKVKVEGRKIFGTTIRHDAERVDECRQRADECQRNAGQLVGDDVLRGAYLESRSLIGIRTPLLVGRA